MNKSILGSAMTLIALCASCHGRITTIGNRSVTTMVHPLRITYHAGEEYRRMSEGLRRVHELIELGILQRGDRIGHGLMLKDSAEQRAWPGCARVAGTRPPGPVSAPASPAPTRRA